MKQQNSIPQIYDSFFSGKKTVNDMSNTGARTDCSYGQNAWVYQYPIMIESNSNSIVMTSERNKRRTQFADSDYSIKTN